MNIQVGKWGNSLAVRIPGALAKEIGVHDGSKLDLQQVSGALILRPVREDELKYSLGEMLATIIPDMLHEETDWGAPVGNEDW